MLDALAFEVSDVPTVPKQTVIDRALDRVAERMGIDIVVHILVRLLRRAAYGKRPDELVDRMALASTQLRLIAPDAVLTMMREIDAATERTGPTGVGWHREWKWMRDGVQDGFRRELAAAR